MVRNQRAEQYSLSGLLFATVGFSLCFVIAPFLHATSKMTPSWTDFVLVMLVFSWCMIPLRQKASRAWWIGFVVFGGLFLALGFLTNDLLIEQAANAGKLLSNSNNDAFGVLVFIPTMLFTTVVIGRVGGHVASAIFIKSGRQVANSSSHE